MHVSDLSWTQRVKHPSELYQKGDEVEAVVLNIDRRREAKVSLGIKQLVRDPWDRIPYDYPVGKIVEAKVIKVLDFGAFVEIEKGIEGLIHVSEISDERVEDAEGLRQAGPEAQGRDHRRRHGRAKDRPVDPRRHARRGAGRRAGLLGRRPDARRSATSCATSWPAWPSRAAQKDDGTNRPVVARAAPMSPEEERPAVGELAGASVAPGAELARTAAARRLPASRTLAWLRQFAKLWGFALFCIFVVYFFREVVAPVPVRDPRGVHPRAARRSPGRATVGGRPLPARARRHPALHQHPRGRSGLFIGYFIPKLSGDFARLFREAPQLFAKLNKEVLPRAGAWVDTHLGAPKQEEAAGRTDVSGRAPPRAPRERGRFCSSRSPTDATGSTCAWLALEVEPTRDGRYVIATPHSEEAETLTAAASGSARSRSG